MRRTPPTQTPLRIGDTTLDRLAFADDVDLCGEKLEAVSTTYQQFKRTAKRPGLEINLPKTKIMQASRQPDLEGHQDLGGDLIEVVQNFKYLGSTVTSSDSIDEEVRLRIAAGSRCTWSLKKLLKSRMLSKRTKLQIYVVIIRPIVLYGCETWRLTKELERQLDVFERSVWRRIYGPIRDPDTGEFRWRSNEELLEATHLPPLSCVQKSIRLRWAGHVARMEETRTPRRVMLGTPEGRRPLGRPRKRWVDNIEEDLTALGVRHTWRWMNIAQDRPQWKQLVKAARDLHGPRPA